MPFLEWGDFFLDEACGLSPIMASIILPMEPSLNLAWGSFLPACGSETCMADAFSILFCNSLAVSAFASEGLKIPFEKSKAIKDSVYIPKNSFQIHFDLPYPCEGFCSHQFKVQYIPKIGFAQDLHGFFVII